MSHVKSIHNKNILRKNSILVKYPLFEVSPVKSIQLVVRGIAGLLQCSILILLCTKIWAYFLHKMTHFFQGIIPYLKGQCMGGHENVLYKNGSVTYILVQTTGL